MQLTRWLDRLPGIRHESPEVWTVAPATAAPAPHERLVVETLPGEHTVRLILRGELDLRTASTLGEALRVEEPDAETIVVDLREVRFLDSTGLAELAAANHRVRRAGGR